MHYRIDRFIAFWNNIYDNFDPIAFSVGTISVHWYGIMYALALFSAVLLAHYFVKKYNLPLSKEQLDSYIWWVEIGIIFGARIGYILFYDPNKIFYFTHPWEIFNPFDDNGRFVGISGMSYHGAVVGAILATYFWSKKYNKSFLFLSDIVALCVPLAYTFGRIGNFMNGRLIGQETQIYWGVYVNGILTHPSALYEAFLEGIVVFVFIYLIFKRKTFNGQLGVSYIILYSLARIVSEFFRAPDPQLGFLFSTSWITMGMVISFVFAIIGICLYIVLYKNSIIQKKN